MATDICTRSPFRGFHPAYPGPPPSPFRMSDLCYCCVPHISLGRIYLVLLINKEMNVNLRWIASTLPFFFQLIFKYYHGIDLNLSFVSSQATEQHTRRDPSGTQSPGGSLKPSPQLVSNPVWVLSWTLIV